MAAFELIRRADLEAIPVSFPDPFLVEKLAPYFERRQEGGTLYYQTLKQAPVAQYNRNTAALADISATIIAAATTTFACKEVRARISMSYDQVRGYYSQEDADIAMAKLAKRAFYLKLEGLCAGAILDPGEGTAEDATLDPVGVIDAAQAALRDKAYGTGKIALTLSHYNFAALKKNNAIIERMKATGVIVDGLSPRYITAEQLAAVFGVDEVLIGADVTWRHGVIGAKKGYAALSVLPDPEVDCSAEPQWARTVIFDWGGDADHYELLGFENPINHSQNLDAVGIVDFKELNPDMKSVIKLADVDDSSSN